MPKVGETQNYPVVFGAYDIRVKINKDSDPPEALVVTQNYHPGWRAYVDGKVTDIYLVNKTFMGIRVSGMGEKHIVFRFLPITAYGVAIFYSILMLISFLILFRHYRLKFTISN